MIMMGSNNNFSVALASLLLLLACLLAEKSIGFPLRPICTASTTSRQHQLSRLFGVLDLEDRPDNDEDDDDDDEFDLDEVNQLRKRLSSLLSANENDTGAEGTAKVPLPLDKWRKQLQSPPPLTSIGRERLNTEIVLLKSLENSDDAIPELWNLWFNSRGPASAEKLTQIEGLVMTGALEEAETMLRDLIDRESVHWVEPVNRLATLLFVSGRLEESKELCEIVLTLKPWHFGALSGMVQLCRGLRDRDGMWEYARKMMPSLDTNGNDSNTVVKDGMDDVGVPTRQAWVNHMVEVAKGKLQQGEETLELSFQNCDAVAASSINIDDADAWQ